MGAGHKCETMMYVGLCDSTRYTYDRDDDDTIEAFSQRFDKDDKNNAMFRRGKHFKFFFRISPPTKSTNEQTDTYGRDGTHDLLSQDKTSTGNNTEQGDSASPLRSDVHSSSEESVQTGTHRMRQESGEGASDGDTSEEDSHLGDEDNVCGNFFPGDQGESDLSAQTETNLVDEESAITLSGCYPSKEESVIGCKEDFHGDKIAGDGETEASEALETSASQDFLPAMLHVIMSQDDHRHAIPRGMGDHSLPKKEEVVQAFFAREENWKPLVDWIGDMEEDDDNERISLSRRNLEVPIEVAIHETIRVGISAAVRALRQNVHSEENAEITSIDHGTDVGKFLGLLLRHCPLPSVGRMFDVTTGFFLLLAHTTLYQGGTYPGERTQTWNSELLGRLLLTSLIVRLTGRVEALKGYFDEVWKIDSEEGEIEGTYRLFRVEEIPRFLRYVRATLEPTKKGKKRSVGSVWKSSQMKGSLPYEDLKGLERILKHVEKNFGTIMERLTAMAAGPEKVGGIGLRDRCRAYLVKTLSSTIYKRNLKKDLHFFVEQVIRDPDEVLVYPLGRHITDPPAGYGAAEGGSILCVELGNDDYRYDYVTPKDNDGYDSVDNSQGNPKSNDHPVEKVDGSGLRNDNGEREAKRKREHPAGSGKKPWRKRARKARRSAKKRKKRKKLTKKKIYSAMCARWLKYIYNEASDELLACLGCRRVQLPDGSPTVIWLFNGRDYNLADVEHAFCKIYINLSYKLGTRAYNRPKPSRPHCQPTRTKGLRPRSLDDIDASKIEAFTTMSRAGRFPVVDPLFAVFRDEEPP